MNLSATDASKNRGWLVLAGLVSVPVYVIPVGFWGVRALWPRMLRTFAKGVIDAGLLSLVTLGVSGLAGRRARQPDTGGKARWSLPQMLPFMSDEVAASAASGH